MQLKYFTTFGQNIAKEQKEKKTLVRKYLSFSTEDQSKHFHHNHRKCCVQIHNKLQNHNEAMVIRFWKEYKY